MLIKNLPISINMTLNLLRIMIYDSCSLNCKMMNMMLGVCCRGNTGLCFWVPSLSIWTSLASHVLRVPNGSIFMTDTKISWLWILLADSSDMIVNSCCRAWLALTGSGIPEWICLIAINFDTLVQMHIERLFGWTGLICLNTTFEVVIPRFPEWTVWYAVLINWWPLMIQETRLTLHSFLIERWLLWGTLQTLEIYCVPIWSGWRTHRSGASFLALLGFVVIKLVRRTCAIACFGNTFLSHLIKILLFRTHSASLSDLVIKWLIVLTFVTRICLLIPEGSFRGAQWVSIIALPHAFFTLWIKNVAFSTLLCWFTCSRLFVPGLICAAFSAFFHYWVEIWCFGGTWLAWVT